MTHVLVAGIPLIVFLCLLAHLVQQRRSSDRDQIRSVFMLEMDATSASLRARAFRLGMWAAVLAAGALGLVVVLSRPDAATTWSVMVGGLLSLASAGLCRWGATVSDGEAIDFASRSEKIVSRFAPTDD